jgi:hypothetical protein
MVAFEASNVLIMNNPIKKAPISLEVKIGAF